MNISNIFSDIPERAQEEIFETIIKASQFKIERIVSRGHSTPKGHWINQNENEWVFVLKGSAGLLFEGNDKVITMKPGDYINISAHQKHRVEWTDQKNETIWLAIHYK